jgi:hypothetical protein
LTPAVIATPQFSGRAPPRVTWHFIDHGPLQWVDTDGGPLLRIPPDLLARGTQEPPHEAETAGEATPSHTRVMVVPTCPPAPGPAASCTKRATSCATGPCRQGLNRCFQRWPPTARTWWAASTGWSPGTGLAALCARAGRPGVRGHARARQASPGGQAQNAQRAARQRAVWRRGGRRPPADVDPADRRAALLPPGPQTTPPSNLPALGPQSAANANRDGGAARVPAPAVPTRLAVARAWLDSSDRRLTHRARERAQTATAHDAQTGSRWPSIPGGGQLLARGRLDAIPAIPRCPRGQACGASWRPVTWAPEAAGPRDGTAGPKIGHAALPCAAADAAVLVLPDHPAGHTSRARVGKDHGPGKARTGLAQNLARAADDRWNRATAVAPAPLHPECWRGRAGRLTGRRGEPPGTRGLSARRRGVRARVASRTEAPQPGARRVARPLAPAPLSPPMTAPAGGVRPRPRPWAERANPHGAAPSGTRTACGPRALARPPSPLTRAVPSPSGRR